MPNLFYCGPMPLHNKHQRPVAAVVKHPYPDAPEPDLFLTDVLSFAFGPYRTKAEALQVACHQGYAYLLRSTLIFINCSPPTDFPGFTL